MYEEYSNKIDIFSKEIHNFAEYIRQNPNNETIDSIQNMYLELLPLEIELISSVKAKFPKLFEYMIKDG
jgi:hypothetical protein